ncbi:MAG TPA: 2-oxoglutarate ferredoxin oxidoreductase subunit alpha [Cryomorphaceae bacterium]|nr:2-oxoglutarate ferredoxin oxidoreductase subunit alpha [Cryomorphaceae bacterium]
MTEIRQHLVVLLAGDSGDGIQLLGSQLIRAAAQSGQDVRTLSDFPAEIRAPQGTVSGVSGFQFQIASETIFDPGDAADVFVAFNVAGWLKHKHKLKPGGILIASSDGFDARSKALAGLAPDEQPLEDAKHSHQVLEVDVKKITQEALKESALGTKEKNRAKNMTVLGVLSWMYGMSPAAMEADLTRQFSGEIAEANLMAFKAGYHLGETAEWTAYRKEVLQRHAAPGTYKTLSGSQGIALGIAAVAHQLARPVLYAGYPITPASDILHEVARLRPEGVRTFQAEDEIASITAAIGASFAGNLGVTASSGPGISLKGEGLGLAVMLELPLLVVNVQRGGPSTGLPTKMEQSDLLQALYGRHGEAPMPVMAIKRTGECVDDVLLAAKMAVEAMTPVLLLSDAYIANSAEPYRLPSPSDWSPIIPNVVEGKLPYHRNAEGVRPWTIPGTPGGEHRIGGLESEAETGNISYDPANHQAMIHTRAQKVQAVTRFYGPLCVEVGDAEGDFVVIGWGSTYGALRTAVENLRAQGLRITHLHLKHLFPLHPDLKPFLAGFQRVVVVEMNEGQLIRHLRAEGICSPAFIGKTSGQPFGAAELQARLATLIQAKS